MWIWLTISMLLVIACIIFGIYSFISSRSLQRSIAAGPGYTNNSVQRGNKNDLPVMPKQAIVNLKTKLKSIEENSLLSAYHLTELKKRIQVLESTGLNLVNDEARWDDAGEDWEKLYYEIKREKQSLEDNSNNVKDALQENINTLQELEKHQAAMRSDVESGISEIQTLQNSIEELQRKVEGGREREKELTQELVYEKSKYSGFELIQKENSQLHSEIEMLTNRLEEIKGNSILMEEKIKSLSELGSILEISDYEKKRMKSTIEQLLHKL